jgi:hypothetical protein
MDTAVIARRLQDPKLRAAFARVHGTYRDIIATDLDCDYLLCTHSLDSLDAESMLPELRRVIDVVKTEQAQRLPYVEMDGEPMHCFGNVVNAAEQDGGSMQTGWLVSAFKRWTGLDLCWHGAWQRPEGDVVEVTPGYERCLFVPSDLMPPTTFTARTFSSIEDMGLCIASTVNLGFNPGEHRDDGYILKSGSPVDLTEAVRRAKLRAWQQALAPKKSRCKQRPKRRR